MPRRSFRPPRPPFYEQHAIDNNPQRRVITDMAGVEHEVRTIGVDPAGPGDYTVVEARNLAHNADGSAMLHIDQPANVQNGETVEIVGPSMVFDATGGITFTDEIRAAWARAVSSTQQVNDSLTRLTRAGMAAEDASGGFREAVNYGYAPYGLGVETTGGTSTNTYRHSFISTPSAPQRFRDVASRFLPDDSSEDKAKKEESLKEARKIAEEKQLTDLSNWVSSTFFADPLMVREALECDAMLMGLVNNWKYDYDAHMRRRAQEGGGSSDSTVTVQGDV